MYKRNYKTNITTPEAIDLIAEMKLIQHEKKDLKLHYVNLRKELSFYQIRAKKDLVWYQEEILKAIEKRTKEIRDRLQKVLNARPD